MEDLVQTNYALDTFYFLVMGALVMFMAPGFAMLEAGLVRSKNTAEILLKNVALFAIACIMYLFVGYYIMYLGAVEGGVIPDFGLWIGEENTVEDTLASGGDTYYSARADYFFQVVFRRHCHVHRVGCRGRADEALGLPQLRRGHDGSHLPAAGYVDLGWWLDR